MRNCLASLGLAVTMLLTGCTKPAPVYVTSASTVDVKDLTDKTVALAEMDDDELDIFCSGVWVAPNVIATAAHCTRGLNLGDKVLFVTKSDMFQPGQVKPVPVATPHPSALMARDVAHDVALLSVYGVVPPHSVAKMVPALPAQGSQVHTLGAPLGVAWSYSRGDVAAIRYLPSQSGSDILTVQVTAPISGGNSGGGLFNDAGDLIGICRATYTRGQNMNLFTHISYVVALGSK